MKTNGCPCFKLANMVDYQYLGKELRKSVISVKPENFKTALFQVLLSEKFSGMRAQM